METETPIEDDIANMIEHLIKDVIEGNDTERTKEQLREAIEIWFRNRIGQD